MSLEGVRDEVLQLSKTTRVFRRELRNGANVICKQALESDTFTRLRNELRILERLAGIAGVPRLAHPSAVDHMIVLEDDGGVRLSQLRPSERPTGTALVALALQLTQIIAAVHRRGVLHKSIQPTNVLLCGPQCSPVLIGFDLATTFAEEQPGFVHHSMIAGSLAYLAPEQTGRSGRSVDQRADLYSFGTTLYELAVGHPPFVDDDPLQLIRDHLTTVPTPPIMLAPSLPQALSDIILRLLEKEPDRRYQSAEGLGHDLSRLIDGLARGECAAFQLGQRDFALRLAPPSRQVGRETEINALQAAFEDALTQRKRGVLVTGAPGVGKTALINTLRPFVTARRGWFVSGKFDQLRQDLDTDAVRQALRALGRLLLAEPEAELVAQRARILEALGPNAGLLATMLPEFALLLAVPPRAATGDPFNVEGQLIRAGIDLLRAIVSPARPLVVVIDDLQWAAALPTRLIDALLTDEALRGLLLVGAFRDSEVDATHPLSAMLSRWARLDAPPLLLPLQNLPPADLGMLLGEMLRLPPVQAASLADAVGTLTAGNPFDTVELVNALRREGALLPGETGWTWDAATIRRFVGRGDVVDLLEARINRLPAQTRALLKIMACLGGDLSLDLLQAGSGLTTQALDEQLAPAHEDGLLVMVPEGDGALRFRHDRVQQAAYGRLEPGPRRQLHLALARRLALQSRFGAAAAEQYLAAIDHIETPDERRLAAKLFRAAAEKLRLGNHAMTERLLAAALMLLTGSHHAAEQSTIADLEIEHLAALYSIGRLEEADVVYRSIEGRGGDALHLVDAACVQVGSLSNRGRPQEAVALGLSLLRQLGLEMPKENAADAIDGQFDAMVRWVKDYDHTHELSRPDGADPQVVAAARIINRLQAPAFFYDLMIVAWLVLESQRLWAKHGPCAALVANLSRATLVTIALRQDYRSGYDTVRHVLELSEARGYEPETSQARHLFAISTGHWFEPLESSIRHAQRAREGLLQGGDLQNACFTYRTTIPALLDCAPTLESFATEIQSGLALAARTGNDHATAVNLADRQLLRALRGETHGAGSFADADFDETVHLAGLATHPMAVVSFHIRRALAAVLYGDAASLVKHAAAAQPLLPYIQGFYPIAWAHLFQALALSERIKTAADAARNTLLAELVVCRDWLALRAADAPGNFLHLLHLVDAEKAWAMNDFQSSAVAFDNASREAALRQRPWHRALITERSGLFHLSHGLQRAGQALVADARQLYEAWGASAKVQALDRTHGFLGDLRSAGPARRFDPDTSGAVDALDMMAILRTSQALSSETGLTRLKARVIELMAAMTGATQVQLVLRRDDPSGWYLPSTDAAHPLSRSVEEAGACGLLPLSAFHYAERTGEPLLVEDATRDDRFARDPYIASLERCSLLVVPISSHGEPKAILLLENRLVSGSFSRERLDAVKLVAGQLAVSLENASLYQELEARVALRTRELRETQSELMTTARRAGMAEIATNVLHNVGNVLTSVNVSADLIGSALRGTKAGGLARAVRLMNEHASDLGHFLTQDEKGKQLPAYLNGLAQALAIEHSTVILELVHLSKGIDHIKDIVATQQSYAGSSRLIEPVRVGDLMNDALHMNEAATTRDGVRIVTEFADVPVVLLDKARVLQILVNLFANATQACGESGRTDGLVTVRLRQDAGRLRISVIDNGVGIAPENLTHIFLHGFTTRRNGHGFGLHGCVLAAQEMGATLTAHSEGAGQGATFILDIPVDASEGPR